MFRNDTSELWYWNSNLFSDNRPHLKYDYDDNYGEWVLFIIVRKLGIVLLALIGYAYISVINALLIRIAIICSNVIILPLLSCARSVLRAQLNRFQIAAIYRSSPHIGA